MDRIYHPWQKWECYPAGFYKSTSELKKEEQTDLCIELYSNPDKFKEICNKVINEWTHSCEHNLTNNDLNKIAWLGQSCCAFLHGISRDISGPAFNLVNKEGRDLADQIALETITKWEKEYVSKEI